MIEDQNLELILTHIKSLKKEYRVILNLRYFEDLSYKEIEEKLNESASTVPCKNIQSKKNVGQFIEKKLLTKLSKLGPGLLFAGAAIGVSHLVQSTRAGAEFGWGLIWAILLINLFKYPFFQYGPRYAQVTGETLLERLLQAWKRIFVGLFHIKYGHYVHYTKCCYWLLPQALLQRYSESQTTLLLGVL